jgi:hypothetical protein
MPFGYLFLLVRAKSTGFLTLILLVLLAGCTEPRMRSLTTCPAPILPQCKPGTFDRTLLDTTSHGPGTIQTHIWLLEASANTNANDNQLVIIPDSRGGAIGLVSSDRVIADSPNTGKGIQQFFTTVLRENFSGSSLLVDARLSPSPLGAGTFSRSDNRLYYSAKAETEDPNDYDLFSARLERNGDSLILVDVRSLAQLNLPHSFDAQPAITPDGKRLYFASDRAHAEGGGVDIWYSERSSSTSADWSSPLPLDSTVNTACDEITPTIAPDGSLYFASNGFATVGGYDLFKASPASRGFNQPENLGRPINTTKDEIFPTVFNDTTFFYASNQPTRYEGMNLFTLVRERIPGQSLSLAEQQRIALEQERARIKALEEERERATKDSIDRVARLEEERLARLRSTPLVVRGRVTQGRNHTPATGSDLFVRIVDSTEIERRTLDDSAQFEVTLLKGHQYDVGAESELRFFDVKRFDLRSSIDTLSEITLYLPDTLVLRVNFPFDDYTHPYEFVIGDNGEKTNTTWQQSIELIARSAKRSLSTLKKLVVVGHTDSMGSDDYNNRLGLNRATFIAGELEKRGIPKRLLSVLSKGRTTPVARREGESDEIFRLRSRRVEFIKVF